MALGDFICCMESCPWKQHSEGAATACSEAHEWPIPTETDGNRQRSTTHRKGPRSRATRKAAHAVRRAA